MQSLMSKNISFTIIIPFKEFNEHVEKSINALNNLIYKDFEVFFLPDKSFELSNYVLNFDYKIIETGNISPSKKRNKGINLSKKDFICFIDDDAYPNTEWLNIANEYINKYNLKAICGPAITPDDEKIFSKMLSTVFESKFSNGAYFRYVKKNKFFISDDWPSVNLIVSRDELNKTNLFPDCWPGEDTLLCHSLKLNGVSIFHIPKLVVFHYRRSNLNKHIKQVYNYGYHRGNFFINYPENSRNVKYLYPLILTSTFAIFLLSLSINLFYLSIITFIPLVAYFFLITLSVIDNYKKNKIKFLNIFSYFITPVTHFCYSIGFFIGMFSKINHQYDYSKNVYTFPDIVYCIDDFGLDDLKDDEILECIDKTNKNVEVSVFGNFNLCKSKISKLIDKKIQINIHIDLIEFYSLTKNQLITKKNNRFSKLIFNYLRIIFNKNKKLKYSIIKAYSRETDAQIKNVLNYLPSNYNIQKSELNCHMHIHIIPFIYRILQKKCQKYGIQNIRNTQEIIGNQYLKFNFINNVLSGNIFKVMISNYLMRFNQFNNFDIKIKNNSFFIGILNSGRLTNKNVKLSLDQIKSISFKDQIKICCHPGIIKNKSYPYKNFYFSSNRNLEKQLFL